MNIQDYKELSEEDRNEALHSDAILIEQGIYMRNLSEQEIREQKDKLAALEIDRESLEEDFNDEKENFKSKLKPIELDISECIHAIKTRSVEENGKQFLIPDYDNDITYVLDAAGNVIYSRAMHPKERQYKIRELRQVQNDE